MVGQLLDNVIPIHVYVPSNITVNFAAKNSAAAQKLLQIYACSGTTTSNEPSGGPKMSCINGSENIYYGLTRTVLLVIDNHVLIIIIEANYIDV